MKIPQGERYTFQGRNSQSENRKFQGENSARWQIDIAWSKYSRVKITYIPRWKFRVKMHQNSQGEIKIPGWKIRGSSPALFLFKTSILIFFHVLLLSLALCNFDRTIGPMFWTASISTRLFGIQNSQLLPAYLQTLYWTPSRHLQQLPDMYGLNQLLGILDV